jgi:putative transposase
MWAHLRRQGIGVARCTVERLVRGHGWRGVTRARRIRTTVPDPARGRAPDLVNRDFGAERPGQLHVADFTHVPLDGSPTGYTAFVVDAYAGLIAGWECSLSKETYSVRRTGDPAGSRPARQARAPDRRAGHSLQRCRGSTPRSGSPRPSCWPG